MELEAIVWENTMEDRISKSWKALKKDTYKEKSQDSWQNHGKGIWWIVYYQLRT